MTISKKLAIAIAASSLLFTSLVHAGPRVTITFKNSGSSDAVYDVAGSSAYTYAEAYPKPSPTVSAGDSTIFTVAGNQSSDVTTVNFQYRIGNKACKFKTSYLKMPTASGTAPKWNKSAEGSGGANCDVRVTNVNMRSHDWDIEFTMR